MQHGVHNPCAFLQVLCLLQDLVRELVISFLHTENPSFTEKSC